MRPGSHICPWKWSGGGISPAQSTELETDERWSPKGDPGTAPGEGRWAQDRREDSTLTGPPLPRSLPSSSPGPILSAPCSHFELTKYTASSATLLLVSLWCLEVTVQASQTSIKSHRRSASPHLSHLVSLKALSLARWGCSLPNPPPMLSLRESPLPNIAVSPPTRPLPPIPSRAFLKP